MAVQGNDEFLTPLEVAALFGVSAKTVSRWANDGKFSTIRTLGGHRRFHAAEVRELVESGSELGDETVHHLEITSQHVAR
jgi:excisionase family DNA binding protein